MKYIFSAIFFIVSIAFASGQTIKPDSTTKYTDTVVIYKDPLVIRKKVFVAPPAIAERKWYAELTINGGLYQNNFYSKNANGISEILKNTIVPTCAVSIGLSLYRKFSKWDIGVGIQLSNYKEKFNYDAVKTTVITTPYLRTDTIDTYYNVINADTNYFYVEETSIQNKYTTQTTTENINTTNTSTFFSIPCQVKYKLIDRKIGLQIVIGIIPSMIVAAKGSSLLERGSGYEVVDLRKQNFTTLSLSGNLGLALVYPILPRTKVSLQPLYSTQLTNIAASNQPYILKRNIFTIQVGIQFEF